MKRFDVQKAIIKYALLLSLFYLFNLAWMYYLHLHIVMWSADNAGKFYEYISWMPLIVQSLFNIVFAILVWKDLKANDIRSPLIVVITLLFGFLGIALFFLQLIYTLYLKNTASS